jgi:hypothetical protein
LPLGRKSARKPDTIAIAGVERLINHQTEERVHQLECAGLCAGRGLTGELVQRGNQLIGRQTEQVLESGW